MAVANTQHWFWPEAISLTIGRQGGLYSFLGKIVEARAQTLHVGRQGKFALLPIIEDGPDDS